MIYVFAIRTVRKGWHTGCMVTRVERSNAEGNGVSEKQTARPKKLKAVADPLPNHWFGAVVISGCKNSGNANREDLGEKTGRSVTVK
jgi:hypothetical protein